VPTSNRFRIEGTVSPKGEITPVRPVQARRNCCSQAIAQVENYLCNRGFRTAIGRGLVLAFWTVDSWPRALLLTSRRSSWSMNITPLGDLQKQPGRAPKRGQPIRKRSRVSIRMFRSRDGMIESFSSRTHGYAWPRIIDAFRRILMKTRCPGISTGVTCERKIDKNGRKSHTFRF
jgi:hypothetical protein